MTISPEQCRAARALLNWSQPKLAETLGVARSTIADFERGATSPHAGTLRSIRATLEAAGVIFLDADARAGPGVRLRAPRKP